MCILSCKHDCRCKPSGCWHLAGYVIGLGDRHSHNILIDQRSADIVHIDLGIAFEQARGTALPAVAAAGKTFMKADHTLVFDVHIKSAVILVQGRFLNTPELIPFRLTRDIVDGFGTAGAVQSADQVVCMIIRAPHIPVLGLHEAPVGGTQAWRG